MTFAIITVLHRLANGYSKKGGLGVVSFITGIMPADNRSGPEMRVLWYISPCFSGLCMVAHVVQSVGSDFAPDVPSFQEFDPVAWKQVAQSLSAYTSAAIGK
jgi:hypothetical protein